MQLIEDKGITAWTLREVARVAGVSHAAPYWHFADKEALLAAVAAEGFVDLRARMERARDGVAAKSPLAGLRALAHAYVALAIAQPSHFRIMFGPELAGRTHLHPDLAREGDAAFQVLVGQIDRAQRAGEIAPGDPRPQIATAWSMVHGLAFLFIDDRIAPMFEGERRSTYEKRVTELAADVLVRGLRLLPPS